GDISAILIAFGIHLSGLGSQNSLGCCRLTISEYSNGLLKVTIRREIPSLCYARKATPMLILVAYCGDDKLGKSELHSKWGQVLPFANH
uniref:hypothetical protein n=1 Tax=Vibrio anguillarum TaxID=55601 RepID=UPI001BE44840